MIPLNELRIGNWIDRTAGEMQVIAIHQDGAVFHDGDIVNAKYMGGIPLTPEILEKCGFMFSGGEQWHKEYKRQYDETDSAVLVGRINDDPNGMYFFGAATTEKIAINNIYHLHELQNAWFSITRTELNIQL